MKTIDEITVEKIDEAKELIDKYEEMWNANVDKFTDDEIRRLNKIVSPEDDIDFLDKANAGSLRDIDLIISRYYTANICIEVITENHNQEAKTEDDFDIKEEENVEGKPEEDVFNDKKEDKKEVMVIKTADGKKQAKKGRMFWNVLGITAAVGAIAIALTKIGGCVSNRNTVTAGDDNNEPTIEQTTDNITTTADVTVTTDNTVTETTVVEPEVSIDELIAEELSKFDGGNSTISAEDYEFMLNYVNDNLYEPIENDNVKNSFIAPAVQSLVMHDITNLTNGVDDGSYSVGNFSFNNLVLENTITKEKVADLEVLRAGMLDEDPEVQKASAKQVLYILHQIARQVTNTKETILIDGQEYNGFTINGTTFDKYYQTEFYELNDASDQVLYLTDLYSLTPLCKAILGDNVTLTTIVKIDGQEVPADFTFEDAYNAIYVNGCGETDENGMELDLYSSVIDESVKSNNRSLENKGYSIILK